MNYFRPVWRYKTTGATEWKRWSPFSGEPFISADPKTISDFEVTASVAWTQAGMSDSVHIETVMVRP